MVKEDTVNLGYSTRQPVEYPGPDIEKGPQLDPNHSHFILVPLSARPPPPRCSMHLTFGLSQVDDGTEGQFGKEIELRGQFEACACVAAAEDEKDSAFSHILREDAEGNCLGWEGVKREEEVAEDPLSRLAGKFVPIRPIEKSLAICLCFEGGPGTVGTVQVSVDSKPVPLFFPSIRRSVQYPLSCRPRQRMARQCSLYR